MAGGTKYDSDKPRLELVSPTFIEATAEILTLGAKKYAPWNWSKGITYGRCFGALMRHLMAWWRGENLDKESGKSHLWHASCELMFLITFESEGRVELDDRYKPETKTNWEKGIEIYKELTRGGVEVARRSPQPKGDEFNSRPPQPPESDSDLCKCGRKNCAGPGAI